MKLYQKLPNAVWYADQALRCEDCKKVKKRLYEIKEMGKFCWECFCRNAQKGSNDIIIVRMIVRGGKGGRI